eukprot:GHVL01007718.1.p1 GENE.GHVL01007718.1~~GHVL01007718.1.p1  ORF type:complete len:215 (+),score=37.01 GHVL01007718.1:248-892(+)
MFNFCGCCKETCQGKPNTEEADAYPQEMTEREIRIMNRMKKRLARMVSDFVKQASEPSTLTFYAIKGADLETGQERVLKLTISQDRTEMIFTNNQNEELCLPFQKITAIFTGDEVMDNFSGILVSDKADRCVEIDFVNENGDDDQLLVCFPDDSDSDFEAQKQHFTVVMQALRKVNALWTKNNEENNFTDEEQVQDDDEVLRDEENEYHDSNFY